MSQSRIGAFYILVKTNWQPSAALLFCPRYNNIPLTRLFQNKNTNDLQIHSGETCSKSRSVETSVKISRTAMTLWWRNKSNGTFLSLWSILMILSHTWKFCISMLSIHRGMTNVFTRSSSLGGRLEILHVFFLFSPLLSF